MDATSYWYNKAIEARQALKEIKDRIKNDAAGDYTYIKIKCEEILNPPKERDGYYT